MLPWPMISHSRYFCSEENIYHCHELATKTIMAEDYSKNCHYISFCKIRNYVYHFCSQTSCSRACVVLSFLSLSIVCLRACVRLRAVGLRETRDSLCIRKRTCRYLLYIFRILSFEYCEINWGGGGDKTADRVDVCDIKMDQD